MKKDKAEKITEIKNQFDELCKGGPSKVMLDIYDYERTHSQRIAQNYGRFISQFEFAYDLIVESVHAINYLDRSDWPKHRGIQFLTLVNNLKPLFSSYQRLIEGFYEDSLILIRPVYESFIKIIYITCNPKYPYKILAGRKDPDGKKFNLSNFLKQELKLNWHSYGYLSAMSHANYYSILSEAIDLFQKKSKEVSALKFSYDEKLFGVGTNDINFLLLVYMKLIVELFATKTNDVLSEEMIGKAQKFIKLQHESFLVHPKEHLPEVAKDVKDVFEMIRRAESGEDWKNAWQEIREKN